MRVETGLRPSSSPKQDLNRRVRRWREWERPAPTGVWQNLAIAFASCAVAAGLTALTLADGASVRPSELWVGAAGFFLATILCVAAHHDVNRGRHSKEREVEEIEP